MITVDQIDAWLSCREDEHVEFKAASRTFSFDETVKYCAALANEGGGHLVLGISPKEPRHVVGSQAFRNVPETAHKLLQKLRLRIRVDEVAHPDGRVVIFTAPSRPAGAPVQVGGRYLMRAGESLTGMTAEVLERIFAESSPDFSAEVCEAATVDDLDPAAVSVFQQAWARKSRDPGVARRSVSQLLEDAELLLNGRVTYAALALFGYRAALGRHLPQAEVVFEYRSSEATGPAQQRLDFRVGFFSFFDAIWEAVDARNDIQSYQEGLFVWDVPTFHEAVVREAVLNAVSHRDYRLHGSVFVRQYSRRLEVVSPGGLPPGITVENILWRQSPRNRRICEAFQRCGLVERSGQGMNRIYEECIRHGNPLPDFAGTDEYQVAVTIRGLVEDPRFVAFLEQVGRERLATFSTEHFLAMNRVHRQEEIPDQLQPALRDLIEQGIVERVGRRRPVLSRRLHAFLGRKGAYTRKVGLDRETNKMLLLKHIRDNRAEGSRMEELRQVLPALTRDQVKGLMKALKREGRVVCRGRTRSSLWYPVERQDPNETQSSSKSNA